jgi:heme exporter protein B
LSTTLGPLLAVPVALPILLGVTQTLKVARYGAAP